MSAADDAPEPVPASPPAPRRPPQLLRRDFLVGGAAGLTAGAVAWTAVPLSALEARLPPAASVSFAQNGEDIVAWSLFRVLKIDRPSYLDIGAYEPVVCNNTYYFYRLGGRGVLVEPNVDLTPKLKRERPGDVVLTAGIGLGDVAEADYYVTSLPQLNTFDKETADALPSTTGGEHRVLRVVKMPLLDINRVIAEHFAGAAPDYLSIDVEGLDLAILGTLDFKKYRPAIVCAEHSQEPAERQKLLDLLAANGYSVRGMTFPNTVFVDDKRLA